MRSKFWPAFALAFLLGDVMAQTAPKPSKATKPAARQAASDYPAVPAGSGYRFGTAPAWVKVLPPSAASAPKSVAAGAKARREPLVDVQVHLAPRSATATYLHFQRIALDTSTLREVSEPQISFNPRLPATRHPSGGRVA